MRHPTSRLLSALAAALLVACGSGAAASADSATTDSIASADTPRADTLRADSAATRVTRAGYVACTSRESLQRLLRAVAAGDSAGVRAFDTETPRRCFPLRAGVRVAVMAGDDGLLSEIRLPDAQRTMWVNREALQ